MIKISKNICYIIGASKEYTDNIQFKPDKNDIVIAADGGYDILKKQGIFPDILLGDFDSIDTIPSNIEIIRHPVEKDDTDTFLSFRTGYERGYRNFIIFGGMGGRVDHTIANFQTLSNIAKCGGRGFLIGEDCVATAIYNSSIIFPDDCSGTVSVFAQDSAKGVTIDAMKYNVLDVELNPYTPLGVSNEFTMERGCVCVKEGTLLVIWYESFLKFFNHMDSFLIEKPSCHNELHQFVQTV